MNIRRLRAGISTSTPEGPLPNPTRPYSPAPSPCIRNCCLREDDVCPGCFRSLDEIVARGTADDAHRCAILGQALQRKQQTTR
ncbi:MAG: DUF1289 domain-containing protein [Thiogranum sp.]